MCNLKRERTKGYLLGTSKNWGETFRKKTYTLTNKQSYTNVRKEKEKEGTNEVLMYEVLVRIVIEQK